MLTVDTIRKMFEDEVMKITKQKTYMDIWQMFALFSILHTPVSVCPHLGESNCACRSSLEH